MSDDGIHFSEKQQGFYLAAKYVGNNKLKKAKINY
jgi:hypothetical protein